MSCPLLPKRNHIPSFFVSLVLMAEQTLQQASVVCTRLAAVIHFSNMHPATFSSRDRFSADIKSALQWLCHPSED